LSILGTGFIQTGRHTDAHDHTYVGTNTYTKWNRQTHIPANRRQTIHSLSDRQHRRTSSLLLPAIASVTCCHVHAPGRLQC